MYRSAAPERRRPSAACFCRWPDLLPHRVTEPIEFTFMFLAPLLYLVHAVLTGLRWC
jgi:hypothetical protein